LHMLLPPPVEAGTPHSRVMAQESRRHTNSLIALRLFARVFSSSK
jgi:hypothetical protein